MMKRSSRGVVAVTGTSLAYWNMEFNNRCGMFKRDILYSVRNDVMTRKVTIEESHNTRKTWKSVTKKF